MLGVRLAIGSEPLICRLGPRAAARYAPDQASLKRLEDGHGPQELGVQLVCLMGDDIGGGVKELVSDFLHGGDDGEPSVSGEADAALNEELANLINLGRREGSRFRGHLHHPINPSL
jgi:hypothetical protein